ncbi:MAG: TonB-dependent receptor [Sphingobium sp.]
MKLKEVIGALAGGVSIFGLTVPAQAQDRGASQAAAANAEDADTIVVTARRRAEDIANVPTTITALGGEALRERSISDQADLQIAVPGLTVRETQSNNSLNYAIRGQTYDAFSGSSTAVVPYLNEVPFVTGGVASFFDLQSVQVLKGPQGTLFGRNTTGGAVLSTTAKPVDHVEGMVKLGYGNYDAIDIEGMANVPLIGDTVLARAAFKITRRDGYIHNVYTGPVYGGSDTRELGKVDRQAVRVSLLVKPGDGIENLTMVQYEHSGGNNAGSRVYSYNRCGDTGPDGTVLNCTADLLFGPQLDANIGFPGAWATVLAAHPGYDPAGIQGVLDRQQNQLGFWEVNSGAPSFHTGKDLAIVNNTTAALSETVTLKNTFGYSYSKAIDATEQTGTPYLIISNYDTNKPLNSKPRSLGNEVINKSISNEIQLQANLLDGGLEYILGAYYQQIDRHEIYPVGFVDLAPIIPSASMYENFKTKDRTEAVFTHGTFDLGRLVNLNGLSFSAGIRYAWEKISLDHQPGSVFFPLTTPDAKFDRASWNLGLEYQATHDLLLYAITRESWRAGGINGGAPPALSATLTNTDKFDAEVARDYEVGLKYSGRLGATRTHLYLSGYTMQVKNVQRALFPTNPINPAAGAVAVTVNVPEARIKGLELDAGIQPSDWLSLGIAGAYTNAKYTKNIAAPYGVSTRFGPVADTPEWSGSAYAVVTVPMSGDLGEVKLRGDIYGQTSFYFSNTAVSVTPQTRLPGYVISNFRLDWNEIGGSQLAIGAWVRNAFNKKYYVGGLPLGGSLGVNSGSVGRPRMYGLELRYKY